MRGLKVFVKSILLVEVAAISGPLVAGAILTWAEQSHRYGENFFTYRIQHLDYLAAWFAASLVLMAINGFWMFWLADIEGMFHVLVRPGAPRYAGFAQRHQFRRDR